MHFAMLSSKCGNNNCSHQVFKYFYSAKRFLFAANNLAMLNLSLKSYKLLARDGKTAGVQGSPLGSCLGNPTERESQFCLSFVQESDCCFCSWSGKMVNDEQWEVSPLACAASALALFLHHPALRGAALNTPAHPVSLTGPVFSFPDLFLLNACPCVPDPSHARDASYWCSSIPGASKGHRDCCVCGSRRSSAAPMGFFINSAPPRERPHVLNCSFINLNWWLFANPSSWSITQQPCGVWSAWHSPTVQSVCSFLILLSSPWWSPEEWRIVASLSCYI